jgi:hypothetical protein
MRALCGSVAKDRAVLGKVYRGLEESFGETINLLIASLGK